MSFHKQWLLLTRSECQASFIASRWHFRIKSTTLNGAECFGWWTTCSHLTPNRLWQGFSGTLWRKATRHGAAAGSSCGSSHKEEALGAGALASRIKSLWSAQQNVSHHLPSCTSSLAKFLARCSHGIYATDSHKKIQEKLKCSLYISALSLLQLFFFFSFKTKCRPGRYGLSWFQAEKLKAFVILRFTASGALWYRMKDGEKKKWGSSHRAQTAEEAGGTTERRGAVEDDPRTIARRREGSRTQEIRGSGAAKRKDGRKGAGKTCATW